MVSSLLDQHVSDWVSAKLGSVVPREEIRSSLGPFKTLPDYTVVYPTVVVRALCALYGEYNRAFAPLVEANREWVTDYQYCMQDGLTPVNWFVQIDMVGLPKTFLREIAGMPEEVVCEILRKRIFEIENSIAMYQLLENLFSRDGQDSFFKTRFRAALDDLREQTGKPIALLAVTEAKYHAMLASEFGKDAAASLTNAEVRESSGFDALFGPGQFRDYVTAHGGQCEYLLYVRSSDPVDKLKQPDLVVDQPLLGDMEMRRLVKAHALTLNVDAPEMGYASRINDTKEYLVSMGMAFLIASNKDLFSSEFRNYLLEQGIDRKAVARGEVKVRCKPAKGAYGCYGHVTGVFARRQFRDVLEQNMHQRGCYVAQPEMAVPVITNTTDEADRETFVYIDRNFFGMVNGRPQFLGGIRNLMPVWTSEARKGRIHGNTSAVYAEIVR